MKTSIDNKKLIVLGLSLSAVIVLLITTIVLMVINNKNDSNTSYYQEESKGSDSTVSNSDESLEASDVFNESNESFESNESEDIPEEPFHGWIINDYGYTYVYNNCGYEQFNYKNAALNRYVNSINSLADKMPKNTRFFNITVPVSSTFVSIPKDIYVNDNFYNQSQSAFVSTVESKLNSNVISVPIVNELEAMYDNGDYVYFKTDKNWTSIGAHRAYLKYCENAALNGFSLSSFDRIDVGLYLGSFYTATELDTMFENPDEFICYSTIPTIKTALSVINYGIVYNNYTLCNNPISLTTAYDFYLGTQASKYEVSTNSGGGALLIISDSSSYPMIPFLASHYSKIDIIDPIKSNDSIDNILASKDYDDCILMCYSTNAISGEFIPELNKLVGGNNG